MQLNGSDDLSNRTKKNNDDDDDNDGKFCAL